MMRLPRLLMVAAVAAAANYVLLITDWADILGLRNTWGILPWVHDGHRFALATATGVMTWHAFPWIARFMIWVLDGFLALHSHLNLASDLLWEKMLDTTVMLLKCIILLIGNGRS